MSNAGSRSYEAGCSNSTYSLSDSLDRYDTDEPLSSEISELDLNAPPSDAADFSTAQEYNSIPNYYDIAGIEPYNADIEPCDYANFGPSTYSRTELRTQLDTLARQLGFLTVESSTAAWEIAASNWNSNRFTMYLTILAMFLKKGGTVACVKLPLLPSHTSSSSSQVPLSPNANKRGHGEQGVHRGSRTKNVRRKLSPARSTCSNPETASTPDSSIRNPLSVAGSPMPVARKVIQFGDAVSVSYRSGKGEFGHRQHTSHSPRPVTTERDTFSALYSKPLTHNISHHSISFTPSTPSTPAVAAISGGPTLLSPDTCFITSRFDQGIRVRIMPETIDDTTETWTDIWGVQFHPRMTRAIPGVQVIGFADWLFFKDQWMSAYYCKILVTESMRNFENDQRNEFRAKILNQIEVPARKPTYDPEGNPKPKHKEVSYPSGDDLGVDWSASQAENLKVRLAMIMRRSLDGSNQDEERNIKWLWYVWRQYGLTRGWLEQPREFGDKVRNPKDSSSLMNIMVKTSKRVDCIAVVDFEGMERSLAGEPIEEFKRKWGFKHRHFGGPHWEV